MFSDNLLYSSFGKISRTHMDLSDEDLGQEDESESQLLQVKMSRTSMFILDYKQFIAARRIQSLWRGYRIRKLHHLRWHAAITIQRWWRGFRVRSRMAMDIEKRLQDTLVEHYHRSAIKIQSLFRGWSIRNTVHDANILRRMQIRAVEDLLHCLAFQLHHLKHTHEIPGVYSMRQSDCLSQVEMIMGSMVFRFWNGSVRGLLARRTAQVEERRRMFQKSEYMTAIPYDGPNFDLACTSHYEHSLPAKANMDNRMFKITNEYEKSLVDPTVHEIQQNQAKRKREMFLDQVRAQQMAKKQSFCEYVIQSMRKWKVWDGEEIVLRNDIFRDAENLKKFFNDAGYLLENFITCHCKLDALPEGQCNPQLVTPIE
ncbi:uncharacterized protein [Drosophila pseudoobscura]|uniref:Spermatogenesis-associated protein 17 n=1 Tax=Drosophila pseudoobscura pseudoobscura TaxID=46245 RepID=A0A6I8UYB4_DROPS|nr:uncharacterized protein LOC6902671 [Drosophila pseudoobscura]